jgi:hypothetical protein
VNIDAARLPYSFDIYQELPGGDLNSNSVVASVLHTVGIDWPVTYPIGIRPGEAPLYGQLPYMKVNDILYGTGSTGQGTMTAFSAALEMMSSTAERQTTDSPARTETTGCMEEAATIT